MFFSPALLITGLFAAFLWLAGLLPALTANLDRLATPPVAREDSEGHRPEVEAILSAMPPAQRALTETYFRESDRAVEVFGMFSPEHLAVLERFADRSPVSHPWAGALNLLAMAAEQSGDLEKSLRMYDRILEAEYDGDQQEQIEAAKLLIRLGRPAEARRRLKQGTSFGRGDIRDRGDAFTNFDRARTFLGLGDHEAARLAFLEGTPELGNQAATTAYLGMADLLMSDLAMTTGSAEAVNFGSAVIRRPDVPVTPDFLVRVAWEADEVRPDLAAELRKQVRDGYPGSRTVVGLDLVAAKRALGSGDAAAAELLFRRVLASPDASGGQRQSAEDGLLRAVDPREAMRRRRVGTESPLVPIPDPISGGVNDEQ